MSLICEFILFCLLTLFSAICFAGNGVANGGNSIVCRDAQGKIASAQFFDLYEIGLSYESEKEGDSVKSDPFDLAKEKLKDLSKVHPQLSTQFQNRLDSMKNEIDFKENVTLTKVDDSLHLFRPLDSKCSVSQVAIRRAHILDSEKRFLVDQNIWSHMKSRSKVGLILHELIYEYFSRLGEVDSRKARILNGKLLKGDIAGMNKAQYWSFIKQMKLPIYPN